MIMRWFVLITSSCVEIKTIHNFVFRYFFYVLIFHVKSYEGSLWMIANKVLV